MSATLIPGAFIREIAGHPTSYCLELVQVIDCADTHAPGVQGIVARRWGVDEQGKPIDDGHVKPCYYADRFQPVGEHAWRLSGKSVFGRPIYWRQVQGRIKTGQQAELFA